MRNYFLVVQLLLSGIYGLYAAEPGALPLPVFDVHFVVASDNAELAAKVSRELFEREIEILNRDFVTDTGAKIIEFRFKSLATHAEFGAADCAARDTLKSVDVKNAAWKKDLYRLYRECRDPRLRDLKAINFIVVDNCSEKSGCSDVDSMGGAAGNRPFVLIDRERLGNNIQSPEVHEMGHAFGLGHSCHPGATTKTATNIMGSREKCKGSGGLRNLGFTAKQVKTIEARIKLYKKQGL